MNEHRLLIVNADDFGLSPGINRGIIESHENGVVTSASLMIRGMAAAEAGIYARTHPRLGVGLHVDLEEWECIQGEWRRRYTVVDTSDADAVASEVAHQITRFRDLVGRNPTHLDSHQHVHRAGMVGEVMERVAHRLDVPLRERHPVIKYCGEFYGQTGEGLPLPQFISPTALIAVLQSLKEPVVEMGCHPGFAEDCNTVYQDERAIEVRTLCDARVRAVLEQCRIELISFGDRDRWVR